MQEQQESSALKNTVPLSNIADPAKQRLFLEHLDSALNKYSQSSTGCNYYDKNGNYVDESSLTINLEEITEILHIRIIATDEDNLLSLEYESPNSEDIEKLANSLIIESLGNALGALNKKFFRRI